MLSVLILVAAFAQTNATVSADSSFSAYPAKVSVIPGDTALFSLVFDNNGTVPLSVSVDMVSIDPRMSWNLIFENSTVKEISVPPASSVSGVLSVSTSSTMPIGTYDFSLKVSGSSVSYFNGSVVVETPVLSLSQPVIVRDGDSVAFSLNLTVIGNVSAHNVAVSLFIDGKLSDTAEFGTVPAGSSVPVSIRGSMGAGTHSYNITAVTMEGYSPVYVAGTETVPPPTEPQSPIPYVLLTILVVLGVFSQVVRVRRRKARLDRRRSGGGLKPEEMLRMDSQEGEQ